MRECAIEWLHGDKVAGVTAAPGSSLRNKIRKYANSHPEEVTILAENDDGSVYAHVPASWIRVSPPRKLSPEQIEIARERLKAVRNNAKQTES